MRQPVNHFLADIYCGDAGAVLEGVFGIKAGGAYFIGDGKTDVEAGSRFGLKTVLVLCGKTAIESVREWEVKPEHVFNDLMEAVKFILRDRHCERTK